MTEKEKIDAAVEKALADAAKKADKEKADAVAKATEDAAKAREDAIEEAKALAIADADAEKQKAIDEAVANARAEEKAASDQRIEGIISDANAAISEAAATGAETARRGGKTGVLKHYVVVGVSFIGGSLIAPGSRVTSDDLGTYFDPVSGTDKPVKPGETLVEVTEAGEPVDDMGRYRLQAIAGDVSLMPIAAVQPFSPNPTRPQGAPAQAPGGVSMVEGHLRTAPPEGVESNAAAAARAQQADNSADAVAAMTAGEKPRRRGSS